MPVVLPLPPPLLSRQCAWGEDELQPLSCTGVHWLNLSLTMVDSLDTLYLLGMHDEFAEAAQ
jgi:mannosyl-oligosaccharide alpha-1,2-mannosidase